MTGLSIAELPWPEDPYRVDLHDPKFESALDANKEDTYRAKLLRIDASNHGGDWGRNAADLADRIDPDLNSTPPKTIASSRYMRSQRIPIAGGLWKLFDEDETNQVVRYDLVKPSLSRDLEGLLEESPKRAANELRADVLRGSKGKLEGFPFAAYHNEYDNLSQWYQGHFHLLVSGDYVDRVENMRGLKGYKSTETVRTPILAHQTIINPAHALTYLIKGYWLQRPFLSLGANGALKRPRTGQRLDAPFHSQMLLWLDQWTLSDLTLLMGIRVTKGGLCLS